MSSPRLSSSTSILEQINARLKKANESITKSTTVLKGKEIRARIGEMAKQINETIDPDSGAVILYLQPNSHFATTLTRKLGKMGFHGEENFIDFVTEKGELKMRAEPRVSLANRKVILVTSAMTDGKDVELALNYCESQNASQVYCAALFNDNSKRNTESLQPNFTGYEADVSQLIGFDNQSEGFFGNERDVKSTRAATPPVISSRFQAAPLNKTPNNDNKAERDKLAAAIKTFKTLKEIRTKKQVKTAIKAMAKKMDEDLIGETPVFLTMQKGGTQFTNYLTEHMHTPFEHSYLHTSRYNNSQQGGALEFLAGSLIPLQGRTVVIGEDVIEKGITLAKAIEYCYQQGAKKVIVACVGDKSDKRPEGYIKPDYTCFELKDCHWLAGTGLDAEGYFRSIFGLFEYPKPPEAAKENTAQPDCTAASSAPTL